MAGDFQFELLGHDLQELTQILGAMGEPAYRGRQLHQAMYRQRLDSLLNLSTFPRLLRDRLVSDGYRITYPTVDQRFTSKDGTVRYLLRFADGQSVETVWMPEGDGTEDSEFSSSPESDSGIAPNQAYRRATICLSSQAGCAVSCQFCMTALLGLQRNLTPGEIVGQVLLLLKEHAVQIGVDRINLVFMGQGEPFLNYDNFIRAARRLVEAGIPESRMTVSTSGIVPRFADFAAEEVRPHLAISLNASNDELRDRLMPINRKWNLEALLAAAREFPLRPRERLTFEYVLLSGVNDTTENAKEVVALLRGLKAKVNLIALNPGPEIGFQTPKPEAVAAFQQTLIAASIPAYLRRPRGLDIYAACGQLKRSTLVPLP